MPMALTDPNLPGNPIVFANGAFLKLSGYSMDEVLGQQPHFMNGPDTDPRDSARFAEAIRADHDDIIETIQYRKNGSRFVATVLISAFKDETGRTLNHFMSWLDVTRRVDAEDEIAEMKSTQARLRASEARLRGVLDGMGEGFGVIGPDFTILEHNREALRMDGRPVAEIVGRSHWEAFPGTEHSEVGLLLKKAMADRQPAFLEHRYRWEEGRTLWLDLRVYPMADGSLAAFWRDVTERKAAEEALRESEERFAQFATSTTDVLWIRDADTMALEYISPAFESVFGVTTGAVNGGIEPGAALVDPADRERVMEHLDAARRGEPQDYEFRIAHGSDGAARRIRDYCFPLIGEMGRVRRIGGIARDVTKLKLAEEALRESEARLKAAFESVPAGLAVLDLDGRAVIANAEFRRFLPSALVPSRDPEHADRWQGWNGDGRLLDPQEWPSARALRGERVVPGQQMLYIDDEGHRIWTNVATAPTTDSGGQVTGVVTVISDIDATKRAQEALRASEQHAQLLLAELQHRVRNTLAVVRSIARRTAENNTSAEDMLAHFQGRLDAFSRVQAAVTRHPDGLVDLKSLIEDELVAHAAREGEQIHIEGAGLLLEAKAAERMSLAVHELTTNAVKHGALADGKGRIRIVWTAVDGAGGRELDLSWIESGLDLNGHKIKREGFGMELLRRSLPYDLNGTTRVELKRDGLQFRLKMPLATSAE